MQNFHNFEETILNNEFNALCPSCKKMLGADLGCQKCGLTQNHSSPVIDLRIDKSFDTLLDVEEYDANHSIDEKAGNYVLNAFLQLIAKHKPLENAEVLEIACGSGLLTIPLTQSNAVSKLIFSDISMSFLDLIYKKVPELKQSRKAKGFALDANNLPFADQSFDLVIGNSVLHHFANFEDTLAESARVLRPGGIAAFGEPVMETQAFVSLAAALIRNEIKRDMQLGHVQKTYSNRFLSALDVLATENTFKTNNLVGDRHNLKDIEDKFVFPLGYLDEVGHQSGFSRFLYERNFAGLNLGEHTKKQLQWIFSLNKMEDEMKNDFEHIFQAFHTGYGAALNKYMASTFTYFLFVK